MELANTYDYIPVYEKMTADLYTPVSAYLRLRESGRVSFLLETVEGKESLGRYSFIGIDPVKVISNAGESIKICDYSKVATHSTAGLPENNSAVAFINEDLQPSATREQLLPETTFTTGSIFDLLKKDLHTRKHPTLPELPSFTGGTVGFIGYENISLIEPSVKPANGLHGETIETAGRKANAKFPELKAVENSISTPEIPGETAGEIPGETAPEILKKLQETPDSILGVYETVIAFDHFKHQMIIISNAAVKTQNTSAIRTTEAAKETQNTSAIRTTEAAEVESEKKETQNTAAYNCAKAKIKEIRKALSAPLKAPEGFKFQQEIEESISDEALHALIEKCKTNIIEGEIFQIVLSKRFTAGYSGDLFNVYRALRIINPSPYMYFLEFNEGLTIIGTSPENLVKVKDNKVEVMPIAGTRRRGETPEQDKKLEENLMNDPKEIAEHVMLVDLARNDVGKVSEIGTVNLTENMKIHRFSHVMHIVSQVEGKLDKNKDCIDALKSCFPAGTVSGAPKIRAMELISQYENEKRNVYAGAVGYIDFSGNLDVCIAIRTLFARNGKINWQAGAGIVADSKPHLETKEIRNKAAALKKALEQAEVLDENSRN
ncbi:MAG: Isochorismate synthase MenF [Ignavibacteriaceae bacterium]|nr:Isochorismate synthase MenF [Ignavibacteriaceae bacterium]